MQDLGPAGSWFSPAQQINNLAQVAYDELPTSNDTGQTQAYFWTNGAARPLGALGGRFAYAAAVNDVGVVVGSSETGTGEWHAFVWSAGVMRDLGTLGGPTSAAGAINRRGDVVGESTTPAAVSHAVLWREISGAPLARVATLR